jgi:hypothetical protein
VSAAYNRGKPPCVCIFFFFFLFPHLRSENIFTTYTHGPRSQKAAYAYESPFFLFLSRFCLFKKVGRPREYFSKGCGVGVPYETGGREEKKRRIIIIITSVTIVFLFASW